MEVRRILQIKILEESYEMADSYNCNPNLLCNFRK